ncbi:MAG: PrsW family glutamic-type intramembrane protease [Cyanobacteria bacterium J06638_20]
MIDFASASPSVTVYRLPAQGEITLGRDPACQVPCTIAQGGVSRFHARIVSVGKRQWNLCDLSSTNGTYLNDRRLSGCRLLRQGDRIRLGHHGPSFIVEMDTHLSPWSTWKPVEAVTLTQLFPVLPTLTDPDHFDYLLIGIITVTVVVVLFMSVGNPALFNVLLAIYLTLAAYYVIYRLCRQVKPLWVPALTAVLMVLLLESPVLDAFIHIFRVWLPGDANLGTASEQPLTFVLQMFLGTGVMEELLKIVPILLIGALGRMGRSPLREWLTVREPLDGIILGTAAAVGFTLVESLGYYVPSMIQSVGDGLSSDIGQTSGLQLLIARTLGAIAGHMAYSGYFGYFLGLSVLNPHHRIRIWLTGFLSAAGLHTLWNVSGLISPVVLALVGSVSYAFLMGAIFKARDLSPNENGNA